MKKKLITVVSIAMLLGLCLAGCATPAQLVNDATNANTSTSSDAASMELVDASYVLHDVMYFKDEVKDAVLIVDNGYVTIACTQDKFMMQFIVNGTNLFEGTYNVPYTYEQINDVGYLSVDFTDEVQYRFTQCTEAEFDPFYKEFEPRMLEVLKELSEGNTEATEGTTETVSDPDAESAPEIEENTTEDGE